MRARPGLRRWSRGAAALCLLMACGTAAWTQPRVTAPPRFDPAPAGEPQLAGPQNALRPGLAAELARLEALASVPAAGLRGPARNEAAEAAWLLGLIRLHGTAGLRDDAQARIAFERARLLGARLAPAGLAWCAIDGCGAAPDPAQAREALTALRRIDPGRAWHLEWVQRQRLTTSDAALAAQSESAASELLQRAARAGNPQARMELALRAAGEGRSDQALSSLQQLATALPSAALNAQRLQERLKAGPAPVAPAEPSPPGQGVTLLGVDNTIVMPGRPVGSEEAYALARRFHRGDGVPANYTEAIRLYRLADAQGSALARQMLGLIYSRPTPDGQVDPAWMRQLSQIEPGTAGVGTARAAAASPWQREATPLSDLLPPRWRTPAPGP